MTTLSVNVNKVATLRNTRGLGIPSVTRMARLALLAGAGGITIHPRPDQRHIRAGDVGEIAEVVRAFGGAELNIEGNPFQGMMEHVRAVRPAQCTLVPDAPDALTSNSGWLLSGEGQSNAERLGPLIDEMRSLGCRVSLFMDAGSADYSVAKSLGADRVELYTEPFAAAFEQGGASFEKTLAIFSGASERARRLGLGVNAGHDLNLRNLPGFLRRVEGVQEVSIGHALIGEALEWGISETVKRYVAVCGG